MNFMHMGVVGEKTFITLEPGTHVVLTITNEGITTLHTSLSMPDTERPVIISISLANLSVPVTYARYY